MDQQPLEPAPAIVERGGARQQRGQAKADPEQREGQQLGVPDHGECGDSSQRQRGQRALVLPNRRANQSQCGDDPQRDQPDRCGIVFALIELPVSQRDHPQRADDLERKGSIPAFTQSLHGLPS